MIQVVRATPGHVFSMRGHVRQADVDELWAGYEVTPEDAMLLGLRISDRPRAALVGEEVLCVFGVVPGQGGPSVPWMVASDKILKHRRAFLAHSRRTVKALAEFYGPMENWVDVRNRTAMAWLRWVGFHLEAPRPYGKHGLDFCHFTMKEPPCAPR